MKLTRILILAMLCSLSLNAAGERGPDRLLASGEAAVVDFFRRIAVEGPGAARFVIADEMFSVPSSSYSPEEPPIVRDRPPRMPRPMPRRPLPPRARSPRPAPAVVELRLQPASAEQAKEDCPVCLDRKCDVQTICEHAFCRPCIEEAVETKLREQGVAGCPICRHLLCREAR